jgi:hypothetical protein
MMYVISFSARVRPNDRERTEFREEVDAHNQQVALLKAGMAIAGRGESFIGSSMQGLAIRRRSW